MIIYVEAVLFDNFFLDFLLAYATLRLTKQKIRWLPIMLSAAVGCAFALFFPLVKGYVVPMKIIVLLISSALFTWRRSFKIYAINTFIYLLLSFLLSGIFSFLLGGSAANGFIGVGFGGVVGVLSIGVISLLYSVRQISGLIRQRKRNEKYAVAELVNRDKTLRINALYDSGNLLTDRNGEGVVVTDRKLVSALGTLVDFGEMTVHTASGSKVLKLVKIPKIKIYSGASENILTNVTAALSDLPDEYALILPCE